MPLWLRSADERTTRVPNSNRSMEQIPWTVYFERELFLTPGSEAGGTNDLADITYHVYLTSPVGKNPLFVTHHGAGSSGLSFAVVGSEIRKHLPGAGILSPDARGHGLTVTTDNDSLDMSLGTLSKDLVRVVRLVKKKMKWFTLPPLILVGHSLGGAVVTDVAKGFELGTAVLGYAVLDVVEGSAMDALQTMMMYLSTRPSGFTTLQSGIEWHIRSRTIRNSLSARTSVPALLTHVDKFLGDGEKDGPRKPGLYAWTWRTDLTATRPYWEGWFAGLSKKFLEAKGGKLLLLSGTDRLDTELTIGQMQGTLLSPFTLATAYQRNKSNF